MSKTKEKEEIPHANGLVTVIGAEGREANNAVVGLITEALARAKDDRARVSVGTNLDLTTYQGKALILKAGSPGDYEVKADKPLRMTVHAYAVFPDTAVNEETGEVSEFARTVLFDKDGKTFRTSAAHAPTRFLIAASLFTPDQWVKGIPFVITARTGKRDRVYHDIQIDTSVPYTL
jgi:hypothetical protein